MQPGGDVFQFAKVKPMLKFNFCKGAYLADVLSKEENDFIKSVLNVINPKDGTDYWLGGLDADKNKGMQWISGDNLTLKQKEQVALMYVNALILL